MAPSAEMKEIKWRNFHEGQGSVVQRASTSGKSFLTFLTPSGERFDTWKKAEAYMRGKGIEADSDQKTLRRPSKNASKSRPSHTERREFREWFWKKKGGQIKKKEYVDKDGSNRRWEVKYISPGGEGPGTYHPGSISLVDFVFSDIQIKKETFRSWKQCVKFLGMDPQPSTTKWALRRRGEGTLSVLSEIFPPVSVAKKMSLRGRVTPYLTSKAGPSASSFAIATNSKLQTRGTANTIPLAPLNETTQLAETNDGGSPNGLVRGSELSLEDSSNKKRKNLRNRQGGLGSAAEDQSRFGVLRSKGSDKMLLIQNNDMDQKSLEKPEEKQSDKGAVVKTEVDLDTSLPQQNRNLRSSSVNESFKINGSSSGVIERRPRRRLLKLQSTSDNTSETKDTTPGDKEPPEEHHHEQTSVRTSKPSCPEDTSKGKEHLEEHDDHEQRSVRMKKSSSAGCSRSRMSSLKVKPMDNGIHTSDMEDHNLERNPSRKNVVNFYEGSKGGQEDQGISSMVSVNDESLQQNLIHLLYADHIRHPSKHTNSSRVIGTLYAEYIERSFSRNQSNILPLATANRRKRERTTGAIKIERKDKRTKCSHKKQSNPEHDRKARRV